MSGGRISRRQTLVAMLKFIALAAGAQVAQLGFLVSNAGAATRANLKLLKVKLSGYDRQVFQNEFGRITPRRPLNARITMPPFGHPPVAGPGQSMPPGGLTGCTVNFGGGGFAASTTCQSLDYCVVNGDNCPGLSDCNQQVCSDNDTNGQCYDINDCNSQDCGNFSFCNENECTGQSCPKLSSCGLNRRNLVEVLSQFRTDPYVQGLMKHFEVTDTRQLASQVERMIRQRRVLMPDQVMAPVVAPSQTPGHRHLPPVVRERYR